MRKFTLAELKAAKKQLKSANPSGGVLDLGDGFFVEYQLILTARSGVRLPVAGWFTLKNASLYPEPQYRSTFSIDVGGLNRFSVERINQAISDCHSASGFVQI